MIWIWIGFICFVIALLALDLGVFHRKAHVVTVKEALTWSAVWITLALAFSAFIYVAYERKWMGASTHGQVVDLTEADAENPLGELDGSTAVAKYITGYVVEKSLSVDNIFLIATIFSALAVPAVYQHRVLFWGILGALLMRGAMITVGATLITRFQWVLYVFAAILLLTAIKILVSKSGHGDPQNGPVVRLARKLFPVTDRFHGEHFFVRAGSDASRLVAFLGDSAAGNPDAAVEAHALKKPGGWMMTPLFLALLLVEFTDLIFAIDSIPAIFAITTDAFLVFTSNVFAMLGLRSLYFALAGLVEKFRYLKVSLAVVLMVVAIKMISHKYLKAALGHSFNYYVLGLVLLILLTGVVASMIANRRAGALEPA